MLRRNDAVNAPAMAAAYVKAFKGQLLPSKATQGSGPSDIDDAAPRGKQSRPSAHFAAAGQPAARVVTLKTFKDLIEDLLHQLKDINELSDKVISPKLNPLLLHHIHMEHSLL